MAELKSKTSARGKPAKPKRGRKPGRKPATGAESTRVKLLKAAAREFSDKGFEGASTRVIAAAVQANHALIKYYFSSKAALWKTVVEAGYADLQAVIDAVPRPGDASEAQFFIFIRRLVRALALFWSQNPELARIVMHEGAHATPRTAWLAKTYIGKHNSQIGELIARAQKLDRGTPGSRVMLTYFVTGAFLQIYVMSPMLKAAFGVDPSSAALANEQAELFLRVFLGAVDWDDPALAV